VDRAKADHEESPLSVAQREPLVAAPPYRPSLLDSARVATIAIGTVLTVLIGAVPLEYMLPGLAGLGLLIAMLAAPTLGLYALLFAIPFSPTFGVEDAGFSISAFEPLALLLILFWIMRGLTRREIFLPREGLFGALVLLLSVLFLAGGGATSYPLAIKETLKWVLLVLAYIFTRVTIRDDRAVRAVLTALFVAGAGQALWGVIQFVLGIGPPAFAIGGFMRAYGNFGQPNPFAGYLGTILPLALAMVLVPHPGRFRAVALLAVALTGLGILLSLSRGAWLGLAISVAVMLVAWSQRARGLVLPFTVMVAIVIVLGMFNILPPILANRITSVTDNFGVFDVRTVTLTSENFAVVERMAHWQAGWAMFVDHPFLGVGPGNYPALYPNYYIPPWEAALGHAHNYYLNMAAEAGVPGLLALLLVLFLAFRGLRRRLRVASAQASPGEPAKQVLSLLDPPLPPAFARVLAIGLLGSLTMFSIHNMFDNLLVHGVGMQIGVLLGLIGGVSNR
jgi:putative inorganic carbon (HCO3(-)) transporter